MRRFTLLALLALFVLAPCGCNHFQKKKNPDEDHGSGFDPKVKQVGIGNQSRVPPSQRW